MVEPASRLVAYEQYLAAKQEGRHGEALLNPTVLVEMAPETTEQYDRGERDIPRIEVLRRPERGHRIRQEARLVA